MRAIISTGALCTVCLRACRAGSNQVEELVTEALGRERPSRAKSSLLANIVTFLPTLDCAARLALPKDLTQDQYTDALVEFMMGGLGLQDGPKKRCVKS